MGFEFTPNEWLVVALVFVLGLVLGAALTAGGGRKHKTRYADEHRRNAELQAENDRLRKDVRTADVDAATARARAPADRI
jgi:hypothetical protein